MKTVYTVGEHNAQVDWVFKYVICLLLALTVGGYLWAVSQGNYSGKKANSSKAPSRIMLPK